MKKSMWHIIILTPSMCLHFSAFKINLKLKFTSHITREFQPYCVSGKLKLIETANPFKYMSLNTERIFEDAFITYLFSYLWDHLQSVSSSKPGHSWKPLFCCCLCCFWHGICLLKKPRYEMHNSPTAAPFSPVALWLFDVNVIKTCRRLLVTTLIESKKASHVQIIHIDGLTTELAYLCWFFFSCCTFSGPFII